MRPMIKTALSLFKSDGQTKRDINSAIGLGASAVLGDTAIQASKALGHGDSLSAMHRGLLSSPHVYGDAQQSINFLKQYGNSAGSAAKSRILGVPVGKMLAWVPPSVTSNAGHPGTLRDVLRLRLLGSRGMNARTADKVRGSVEHYKGFVRNPHNTLLREVLTNKAHGGFKDLNAASRNLGLSGGDLKMLLSDKTRDPLQSLFNLVRIKNPDKVPKLTEALFPLMRDLTIGDRAVTQAQAVLGKINPTKALSVGPAAYGAGARAVSGKLAPVAAVIGGGIGLWGGGRLFKDHVKFSSAFKDYWNRDVLDRPSPWQAVAGGVSTLAGVHTVSDAMNYSPSNLIMSTGGRLTQPAAVVDIGAGHVTPARAIHEALQSHPAVRSGEFVSDIALREMDHNAVSNLETRLGRKLSTKDVFRYASSRKFQKPIIPESIAAHGRRHAVVTVDSGFGLNTMGGVYRKPGFSYNPDGVIGFVPDSKSKINYGSRILFGAPSGTKTKNYGLMTFGTPGDIQRGMFERVSHYPVHPALSDDVLNMASQRAGTHSEAVRSNTWTNLAQKLEDAGDKNGANTLRQALADKKKIITITGSTRGDYVAQRAAVMDRIMSKNPEMAKRIQIVNMLGSQHEGSLTKSILGDAKNPMVNIGDTRKYFGKAMGSSSLFDIINASDLHYGSTGASAYAESNMSRTPSRFITNYKPWRQSLLNTLKRKKVQLTSADHSIIKFVDLDDWNEGTLKEIRASAGKKGIGPADDYRGIKRMMTDLLDGKIKPREQEAASYLRMARESKAQMADVIINRAREVSRLASGKMMRRLGVGGLLTAGGGLAINDYLKNRGNTFADKIKRLRP